MINIDPRQLEKLKRGECHFVQCKETGQRYTLAQVEKEKSKDGEKQSVFKRSKKE